MIFRKRKNQKKRGGWLWLAAALLFSAAALPADWDLPPATLARRIGDEGELRVMEYLSSYEGGRSAHAGVYLPPNYDPEGAYDVVVLWPGTLGNYKAALQTGYPCPMADGKTHTVLAKPFLDRMIVTKRVRPFILLCMEDFPGTDAGVAGRDVENALKMLRENFAVYKDLPAEELRRHYTLLGYSQGSVYAEGEGLVHLYDRFYNFGTISFGSTWNLIPQLLDESEYELGLLYKLVGDKTDPGAKTGRRAFEVITRSEKATPGENAVLMETERFGHGYELMILGLYDFLPRVLPPEVTP